MSGGFADAGSIPAASTNFSNVAPETVQLGELFVYLSPVFTELKFTRIIPRLDIKGPNLVKGIHLEGLRTLGRPEDFAAFYYAQGADELIFQDTVASLYERNSLTDVISRTAKDIFIPLTVGGGIRTIEDISNVLRAGADKVAINTAAIQRPGTRKAF